MATSTGRQPPAAALTYLTRYTRQTDAFKGRYGDFYKSYHPVDGLEAANLFETVVTSAQNIPKVFLSLVQIDKDYRVLPVHRPSRYEADLAHPSPHWDDQVFAFVGDIRSGSHFLKTVTFPTMAFTRTDSQRVHPLPNMDSLWAANADTTEPDTLLGPATGKDAEAVVTRHLIPVPSAYVPLVFNKTFSPADAWTLLSTAIHNDGRSDSCSLLLDWLRVSCTSRRASTGSHGKEPATCLGSITTAFPPVIDDSQLDRHRWNIITRDLPALARASVPTAPLATPTATADGDKRLLEVLSAMQADRAAERANDDARRLAEKQDKLPSATKYRTVAREWMAFCSVNDETDLPLLYHQLVNGDKGEHLALIRNAIQDRARSSLAATDHTPVVSKETKEMILTGRFGVEPHRTSDLSLGLQPFSMGLFLGDELSKTVELRATSYESMLQGLAAPTLGEQATFSTKEIRIPQDPFTAGMMLSSTSVQLDVLQGPGHPFASAFRHFCTTLWPSIATTLHLSSRYNPAMAKSVIPRILRWIQTHMVCYIHQLMLKRGDLNTPLPPFDDLQRLIALQQYNLLPELPDAYRIFPQEPSAGTPLAQPPALPSPSPAPPTKAPAKAPDSKTGAQKGRGGALVTNPTLSVEWKERLEKSSKRIRDISASAPDSDDKDDSGKPIPICLSYHLRGHCYSSCNRIKTHRALSHAESTALSTLVNDQLSE